jgi:tRNA pseudouridine38-40 synthase
VTVYGAGRTDAGVHATGQVAHVDLAKSWEGWKLCEALNFYMAYTPVVLLDAELVSESFHARFSARERAYLYRILNRSMPSSLERYRSWHIRKPLNIEYMQEAAGYLVGHHDFSTFRDSDCQASSALRTLDELTVTKKEEFIEVTARARSFLHHQVRNMVGTLKLVGEGKWLPERVRLALDACDRKAGGPTAPPHGLYLTGVTYE